jgi:hypothetical protein
MRGPLWFNGQVVQHLIQHRDIGTVRWQWQVIDHALMEADLVERRILRQFFARNVQHLGAHIHCFYLREKRHQRRRVVAGPAAGIEQYAIAGQTCRGGHSKD